MCTQLLIDLLMFIMRFRLSTTHTLNEKGGDLIRMRPGACVFVALLVVVVVVEPQTCEINQ